jgi:NAD(P)-dependent dehydrogenase (short-subunit alcohol dehydrogenase family)
MGLEKRVVLITGATGGLGRVVSYAMAQAGARLALVSTSTDKLKALEEELQLPAERCFSYATDLSQPAAAQEVVEAVLNKFGRLEILLHFVGGWTGGKPVTQVAVEDVAAMLQQHVWTTFYMAQAAIPRLVSNGWGRMIVVSSPSAATAPANMSPYTVGKAAQEALMLSLAEELKGSGVTANVLRVRTIDVQHEREHAPVRQNAAWTTPEEIAAAILYLCSDEAGMVNGARIPLYGSP